MVDKISTDDAQSWFELKCSRLDAYETHVTIIHCVPLQMRSSIAPNRVSHAHALSVQANNPASVHRLLEKKKEYEAVAALERTSALYVKRIEGLADDCEVMADAGQGESTHAWDNPSSF